MAPVFRFLWLAVFSSGAVSAHAEPPQFDLTGPPLKIQVTHLGATLPISQVPNLASGDRIWIKADLPEGQSVRYLLIAAFLRGATNPPPESWFFRSQTWDRKNKDGLKITVPDNAQQLIVFLAPQTGGDFKTLVGAVRGRPGAFVRASQDLNQASLDRSRIQTFLGSIQKADPSDPDHLKTLSALLARSLTIKLNSDCFQKAAELQAACLMQGQDALVLNDGHSTSIVQALTSGETADLVAQLSNTSPAGFGYYSPYIGAIMDFGRIMDSFHTAQYQYIPALAAARDDRLALLLNTPPSFHNPMSVLVVALPAIEPPQAPPIRPVDPNEVYCADQADLVLPVEGAPLAFSTSYAHDMTLKLKSKGRDSAALPVHADAARGGLVADARGVDDAAMEEDIDGSLQGYWGFTPFDGPAFKLRIARPQQWRLSADDQQAVVVGRDDVVHLRARTSACVRSVAIVRGSGSPQEVDWKATGPDQLDVTLPLKQDQPGPLTLEVSQFGSSAPDRVSLQAYAQAGHLDGFDYHAGDLTGVLKGTRLDEVVSLTLAGVTFKPALLTSARGGDMLSMTAADASTAAKLKAGSDQRAKIALKDERVVRLDVVVGAPRPNFSLIGKNQQPSKSRDHALLQLHASDELAQGDTLTFSVRAHDPTVFSGEETVEVATADGQFSVVLTPASGLFHEDAHVALATLDTAKAFNFSAFGALRFRVIDRGVASDWQPLTTLVRVPMISQLTCPAASDQLCQLSGSNLFLLDSLAGDPDFSHPAKVQEGFSGDVLTSPRPTAGRLYVKLHDDPSVVHWITAPS